MNLILCFVCVCVQNETELGCDSESSEIMQPGFEDDVVPSDCESPTSSTLQVSGQHSVLLEDDPTLWPKQLSDGVRCSTVQRGPLQLKDRIFPRNEDGRRFTSSNYYIQRKNGEQISRSWLVYSEKKDCVICSCCRPFGNRVRSIQLTEDGFNDWKNLSAHLRTHEKSSEHIANMDAWHNLSQKLQTHTGIDQVNQNLLSLEVNRWKEVLTRLMVIVNHLAEHNQCM